jgi:hypothetical protein
MSEERKFTFIGKRGVVCNKPCFPHEFGVKDYRETSSDYEVPGYRFYPVSECAAPGAPGLKSKLGRCRICVVNDPKTRDFCRENKIELFNPQP